MTTPNLQSTSLLTEHLEYPPISLLDDIINTVNDIMYKCTAAMEKYLLRKAVVGTRDYSAEVRVGVAKLETLLEHTVDRNFDRLELYVLRNVLSVPLDLVQDGSFRLAHQRDIDMKWVGEKSGGTVADTRELETRLALLREKLALREQLTRRVAQVAQLQQDVRKYHTEVKRAFADALGQENSSINEVYASLRPLDDAMRFLVSQLRSLYGESEEQCSGADVRDALRELRSPRPSSRAQYISSAVGVALGEGDSDPAPSAATRVRTAPRDTLHISDPDLSILK